MPRLAPVTIIMGVDIAKEREMENSEKSLVVACEVRTTLVRHDWRRGQCIIDSEGSIRCEKVGFINVISRASSRGYLCMHSTNAPFPR